MQIKPPKSRNDPCPCGSGKRYKQCHGLAASSGVSGTVTDRARALAVRGLEAHQRIDMVTAETLYRESLALEPDNVDVLHMLGVVLMQRFELAEALPLIARAAELVDWQTAAIRHNYGWALSVLMSARTPGNLPARAQQVAQLRQERRALSPSQIPSVAILALCQSQADAEALVDQLRAQTRAPREVVLLLPEPVASAMKIAAASCNFACPIAVQAAAVPQSVAAISFALQTIRSRYVQLVHDAVTYDPVRVQRMSDELACSGARWGFTRVNVGSDEQKGIHGPLSLMLDALNGLDRLQHRMRLGDLLLERPGLPITLSNFMIDRELLADVLNDPLSSPPTALGFSLAALWRAEPVFVNAETLQLSRATLEARQLECVGDAGRLILRTFVDRTLASELAVNPLAPHVSVDGVDIFKRALRGGLGSALDKRQLLRIEQLTRETPGRQPLIEDGIEFIGFARAESGLGENLRALVRASATTELASVISVSDVDIDSGIRNADTSMSAYMDGRMFQTRVICVNPDLLGEAFHHDGYGRYADAYRIGFWFWELERIPRMWVDHARLVDEIWVATDFVASAVRQDVTDRPVIKIRTPVTVPMLDRAYTRTEFGLREGCCLFMFSFAFGSFSTRKNPEAAVRAFRQAFPLGTEDVQIVIKTSQSELYANARDVLMALAGGDPRIVLVNRYMSRAELIGLQSAIDCYVSLHRSEGLGLGLAECMAQGKPAIATAYSGNLEFMNSDNSLLVDYTLVPVREGEYPDYEGQVWADASVEHAAIQMQKVYQDRELARRIGQSGAQYIARHFSHEAIGRDILRRYKEINRGRNVLAGLSVLDVHGA